MFKKQKIKILFIIFMIFQLAFSTVLAVNNNSKYEDEFVVNSENDDGPTVTAEIVTDDDIAEIEANQINDDIYKIAEEIEIKQAVSGNVYLLAENTVEISSPTIYGNLFILAEDVKINAGTIITGSTYIVAKNLEMDAITSDLYAAVANKFIFGENAATYRDLKVAAGNAELNGNVLKNAYLSVEEEISCGKEFAVDGILNYTSKKELNISNDLAIGEIKYTAKEDVEVNVTEEKRSEASKKVSNTISSILIAVLVAGLISLFRRDYFETEEADITVLEQIKKIGIGILGLIVIPILVILIITTIVGLPVALVVLSLYILMICVATAIGSAKIASIIRIVTFREEKISHLLLLTAIIAGVVELIDIVPVIGNIIQGLVFLFGFGTMILRIFRKRK